MEKAIVIGGKMGDILARQKASTPLELGELLVSETPTGKILMQVFDLNYGSQLSQQNLELLSGLQLEERNDLEFMDPHLRHYTLACLKGLLHIGEKVKVTKNLPTFLSSVRGVRKEDLSFLTKPSNPLFIGHLRSGSSVIDVPVYLDGLKAFSHHILIPATTGKGKSNLVSCMLWQSVEQAYCGLLVLDPHDEYYGRNGLGLKDHHCREKVVYYTPKDAPPGTHTLRFHVSLLRPGHFRGAMNWTDAQTDALNAYYRDYKSEWVEAVLLEKPLSVQSHEKTLAVVKRRLGLLLGLDVVDDNVVANGVFDLSAGKTTITDIISSLESGKVVIVDTSQFEGRLEILIGSLIASTLLARYRQYRLTGELRNKPVVSIFIEEAPRVLGKAVLENGPNIFSTIAREGRKFKIGLAAITQLPSLIPRDILANMNTKLILGTEMKPERQALIESAAQDLSEDDRTIASLDKGECIVSSNFAKFATPVYVPLFTDYAKQIQHTVKTNYSLFKEKNPSIN